jgi:hypothetical protein
MNTGATNQNGAMRELRDLELDLVNGGVIEGGCIRLPILGGMVKTSDWSFEDQFTRYTIGRYTKIPG